MTIITTINNTIKTQKNGRLAIEKSLIGTSINGAMRAIATQCDGWTQIYEDREFVVVEW
jgi:hypothetical protein